MSLPPQLTQKVEQLEAPEPLLVLWQVWLDEEGTERRCFVKNSEPVVFDGVTYQPFPITITRRTESTDGAVPSYSVQVSNITRELMGEIDAAGGLINRRVEVRLVDAEHLDDPTEVEMSRHRIRGCSVSPQAITFEIGSSPVLEALLPGRRFAARCIRIFMGRYCRYQGALTTCDHTFDGDNGCIAHGVDSPDHPKRFGGFPTMGER